MAHPSRPGDVVCASDDRDNVNSTAAVTVVIPTRDRVGLLLRTLDSVVRQVGVPLEVIVVDDGGSVGIADVLATSRFRGVRVIRHPRSRGVSAARNTGLAEANTPWVAFTDDDDLWEPTKLRAQLDALEGSSARWCCVSAVYVDGDVREFYRAAAPRDGDVSDEMLRSNVVPGGGSGVLLETRLAHEVGGFDEHMSILADWDFYLRLSLESPMAAVDRALMGYYVHNDSMYHNPVGVARELHFMRQKYQQLSDGRDFHPDWTYWYITLAGMARRLGDRGTAVRLLLGGAVDVGAAPLTAHAVSRLLRKVRRRGATSRHSDGTSCSWLDRYRGGESLEPGLLCGIEESPDEAVVGGPGRGGVG